MGHDDAARVTDPAAHYDAPWRPGSNGEQSHYASPSIATGDAGSQYDMIPGQSEARSNEAGTKAGYMDPAPHRRDGKPEYFDPKLEQYQKPIRWSDVGDGYDAPRGPANDGGYAAPHVAMGHGDNEGGNYDSPRTFGVEHQYDAPKKPAEPSPYASPQIFGAPVEGLYDDAHRPTGETESHYAEVTPADPASQVQRYATLPLNAAPPPEPERETLRRLPKDRIVANPVYASLIQTAAEAAALYAKGGPRANGGGRPSNASYLSIEGTLRPSLVRSASQLEEAPATPTSPQAPSAQANNAPRPDLKKQESSSSQIIAL
jgi:hypothetical protein